jgi:hypothetical protein
VGLSQRIVTLNISFHRLNLPPPGSEVSEHPLFQRIAPYLQPYQILCLRNTFPSFQVFPFYGATNSSAFIEWYRALQKTPVSQLLLQPAENESKQLYVPLTLTLWCEDTDLACPHGSSWLLEHLASSLPEPLPMRIGTHSIFRAVSRAYALPDTPVPAATLSRRQFNNSFVRALAHPGRLLTVGDLMRFYLAAVKNSSQAVAVIPVAPPLVPPAATTLTVPPEELAGHLLASTHPTIMLVYLSECHRSLALRNLLSSPLPFLTDGTELSEPQVVMYDALFNGYPRGLAIKAFPLMVVFPPHTELTGGRPYDGDIRDLTAITTWLKKTLQPQQEVPPPDEQAPASGRKGTSDNRANRRSQRR